MFNEFSYATNDPLLHTDPYGEISQVAGAIVTGIGLQLDVVLLLGITS